MSKSNDLSDSPDEDSHNYRILVKNINTGKFSPIAGIYHEKPIFEVNVICGLVLWNLSSVDKESKFTEIREKYPNLEFKFIRTE